jgi:Ti-type conjugative transfer relaxase TraA
MLASLEYQWKQGRELLSERDVLVIDEAGLTGTRQMERVLSAARDAGAKVVLVGDPEQLQAIEAGAAFRSLAEAHGAVEITEIRRQRDDWQRDATRALATGRTREAARGELVEGWDHARNNDPSKSRIILTHTNAEVRDLNIAARDKLRDGGELGDDVDVKTERGERHFASGDRMMFLRNERGMGVKNGTLGTVEQVTPGHMAVRTDDGRSVAFDLKDYAQIDHGYAATFHKSQGVTVDQAHILATPGMDRHSAYVGLTRHRDGVQVHYGRDDFADQSKLVRTLSRERAKDMASDYPLPDAPVRAFAERREFRFGEVARDMVAKARGILADPDRIAALRGRLDKALGREPSAAPEAKRDANLEPGQDRGTDTAANRLRARMAELGKQVRKDDERDRDRTKDRDRDRGGPGR